MKRQLQMSVCMVAVVLCLGCAQNRVVLSPELHDMNSCAPDWALANSMQPSCGMVYFVGVSQEQVTSETNAIEQAHQDALRKASDYVGMHLGATNAYLVSTETATDAEWPYRITYKLNFCLKDTSQLSRSSSEQHTETREAQLQQSNWIAKVNIVDTWSVAERFANPCRTNQMRYGELWKAKVLAAIPEAVINEMAEYKQDAVRHEYEYARKTMESADRTAAARDQAEWQTEHNLNLREREMKMEMKMREFEAFLDYRIAAGKQHLKVERPTFNFMNNTYLYGTNAPFPGQPFTPCMDF